MAATVLALASMGGLTAAPAFAYGDLGITILDDSTGGPYAGKAFELAMVGGPYTYNGTTASDGTYQFDVDALEAGDYIANPSDPTYARTDVPVTIADGTNSATISFDKYRVTGFVQADTGNGQTTAFLQRYESTAWADLGSVVIGNLDDSFSISLPDGPGTYRLLFVPNYELDFTDTFSADFVIDGSVPSVDLDVVSFAPAAVIRGTVRSDATGDPLDLANVYFETASASFSTTTDSLGHYRIRLPDIDELYTVSAEATGFLRQYWNYVDSASVANPVVLDAGNSRQVSDIDFGLLIDDPDLTINVLADTGAGPDPYSVDYQLFKLDDGTGLYSSTPTATMYDSSSTTFENLAEGSYRLAVSVPATGVTLPWLELLRDTNAEDSTAPGGDCYIPFDVTTGGASIDLADVLVDSTVGMEYCDEPAWSDPSDGTVSGSVDNILDFDFPVVAKLFQVGIFWGQLVDVSPVDPSSGAYTLSGVRTSGDYYVRFVTDSRDPYLDTLLGAGGFSAWDHDAQTEYDVFTNHPIQIDVLVSNNSVDNDVELEKAAILTGTVTSGVDPLDACVQAEGVTDPLVYICSQTDVDGNYTMKVRVGDEYILSAEDLAGAYFLQYWDNAEDVAHATTIETVWGANGPFDFDLTVTPAALTLHAEDDNDPGYDFTVHLYADVDGTWIELPSTVTASGDVDFYTNYETLDPTGLIQGDYRVRVQDDNGTWLAATEFGRGFDGSTSSSEVDPGCYIDLPGIGDGLGTYVSIEFDRLAQTESCDAEPRTYGDVTGSLVESAVLGDGPIANQDVSLEDSNGHIYEATTAGDGSFVFEDVVDGTYVLYVDSRDHVDGEHSYVYYESSDFDALAGGDFGPIALTRYGNVTGSITNWGPTLVGTKVLVYTDTGCGCWDPSSLIEDEVDSLGNFQVPGIDLNGQYSLFFQFPSGYLGQFLGGGTTEPGTEFHGTAELDYSLGGVTVDLIESEVISGHVSFNGVPITFADHGAFVLVTGIVDPNEFYVAFLDGAGDYSIEVAPNTDYQVSVTASAFYGLIYDQVWNGHDVVLPVPFGDPYPGADAVEVGTDPVGDVDFELHAVDEVYFDVLTLEDDPLSTTDLDLPGIDVHLYEEVPGGWNEVETSTSTPWSYLDAAGDGDYRLRFSSGSDWLSVDTFKSRNFLPPYDSVGPVTLSPGECFIDFENVAHGSALEVQATLNTDPSAVSCAQQDDLVDYNNIEGYLEDTLGDPVAGQTVELYDTASTLLDSTTSEYDGFFEFEDLPIGDYWIYVPTAAHLPGEHSYVEVSLEVTVDEDEYLDPIELTRYGNVYGNIPNWNDAAMNGATALVYLKVTDGSGVHWEPTSGVFADIDSNGDFEVPGIGVDGEYSVWLHFPGDMLTGYIDDYATDEPYVTFWGDAEEDYTNGLYSYAMTTISGTVTAGGQPLAGAEVDGFGQGSGLNFSAITDASGEYSMAVRVDDIYDLDASKAGYVRQWEPDITVDYAAVDVDFELPVFEFSVTPYVLVSPPSTYLPYPGVDVHLYQQVTGGWQEVDVEDASPEAIVSGSTEGNYRLRFSDSSGWLAIDNFDWVNHVAPGQSSLGVIDPDPNVCFLDLVSSSAGQFEVELALLDSSYGVTCTAEPALVGPPAPPSGSTGGGSGGKKHVGPSPAGAAVTTESTSTPAPTPTPSVSDEPTETPTDAPTTAPIPPATGGADFTWLWWVGGLLLVLILCGGAFVIFFRRP